MIDTEIARKKGITVRELVELLKNGSTVDIEIASSTEKGLNNKIHNVGINRSGLSLTGFTKYFAHKRVQVFGREEVSYLEELEQKEDYSSCEKFLSYDIPCCFVSYNQGVPTNFINMCYERNIPILVSSMPTSRLTQLLIKSLDCIFAPQTTLHGTLMEISGMGVLIQGKSGVGKSETALGLIKRGNKLVADDKVIVKRVESDVIQGECDDLLKYYMEIRGIGIINVQRIFGVDAVKSKAKIELIIHLEKWKKEKEYDRLGLDEYSDTILDTKIPRILIPVRPGRNIPIIVETAIRNHMLKLTGYNAPEEYRKKLNKKLSAKKNEPGEV